MPWRRRHQQVATPRAQWERRWRERRPAAEDPGLLLVPGRPQEPGPRTAPSLESLLSLGSSLEAGGRRLTREVHSGRIAEALRTSLELIACAREGARAVHHLASVVGDGAPRAEEAASALPRLAEVLRMVERDIASLRDWALASDQGHGRPQDSISERSTGVGEELACCSCGALSEAGSWPDEATECG